MIRILLRLAVLALLACAVLYVRRELQAGDTGPRRPQVQRVRLLDAPRPAPLAPTPRLVQPRIEERPEIRSDKFEPAANVYGMPGPPIPGPPGNKGFGERLAVDAEGAGGADLYGLEGKPGGRDITTIGYEKPHSGVGVGGGGGGGGGAGGNGWRWYGGLVAQRLQEVFGADQRLHGRVYTVVLEVWITADGRVVRYTLGRGSGYDEIDAALAEHLSRRLSLGFPAPLDMPQPVVVRVRSAAFAGPAIGHLESPGDE